MTVFFFDGERFLYFFLFWCVKTICKENRVRHKHDQLYNDHVRMSNDSPYKFLNYFALIQYGKLFYAAWCRQLDVVQVDASLVAFCFVFCVICTDLRSTSFKFNFSIRWKNKSLNLFLLLGANLTNKSQGEYWILDVDRASLLVLLQTCRHTTIDWLND